MKRLLLVGAGHAHVHVLRDIAAQRPPGTQVVLVTPFARQFYSGMLPGLVAGHYGADECSIPIEPLAQAAGVELAQAAVVGLDAQERVLTLSGGREAEYDILSLDCGGVVDRDAIPGAREFALALRPIEHFVQLIQRVVEAAEQRAIEIVVIGGGAGGFELALALQFRLSGDGRERARVSLITGGPPVLADYAPGVQWLARSALRRARIAVFQEACTAIEETNVTLANAARPGCDVPLLALGVSAPDWLRSSGLALDERGFVATGATLQSTSHPNVFAVGDVASRSDMMHPRSGVYAVRASAPLAVNLRRYAAGGQLVSHTPPRNTLNLLSCGEKRAIASWNGLWAAGEWVWRWKDRVDREFIARFAES